MKVKKAEQMQELKDRYTWYDLSLFAFTFIGEFVGVFKGDAGAFHSVDDECDAYQYEWNAEPLSHVESHWFFPCNLIVLYEFDEETRAKYPNEEDAE